MLISNPFDRVHRDIRTPLVALEQNNDPVIAHRGRMFLELVNRLAELGPSPRTVGIFMMNELRLIAKKGPDKITAQIAVDWKDYGQVRDGVPEMHYRIGVHRHGKILTDETRTNDVVEAGRFILEALDK